MPPQTAFESKRQASYSSHLWDNITAMCWLFIRRVRQKGRSIFNWRKIKDQKQALQSHFSQNLKTSQPCFVFAPGLTWDRQLFQRPQQLALSVGRQGYLVYYLEPDITSNYPVITHAGENVWLVNAFPETLSFLDSPYLYLLTWSDSPARFFKSHHLIYDIVDDFSAFHVNQHLLRYQHFQRIRQAECVLVTARRLMDWIHQQRSDAMLIPNAVDYSHFHNLSLSRPKELNPETTGGKPIIGYYGALANWIDYSLLTQLVRLRPDLSLVLIGPSHDKSLESSGLLQLPNVHWLGPIPYPDLPVYLQAFDVAIIPFKVNPLTNATSPIKLFEYMAGNKPVVCTPIAECLALEGVLIAQDAAGFSEKINLALVKKNDSEYIRQIDRIAQQNTWDARTKEILDRLHLHHDSKEAR